MLDDLYFTNVTRGGAAPKLLGVPSGTTAGGVYMAKLGDYMFSLDTAAFQRLERNTRYRWAMMQRIGREPAHQFTGAGEDTIELSGVIYPHFRGGLGQLAMMRAAAGRGEPMPLVYGFDRVGQYCGRWCIVGIKDGRSEFRRDGTAKKIEFSLSLSYYGEDEGAAGQGVIPGLPAIPTGSIALPSGLPGPLYAALGGSALSSAAAIASSLPMITPASLAGDIQKAAGALSGVANAAALVATNAGGVSARSIVGLAAGVAQLLPANVRVAAGQVVRAAQDIVAAKDITIARLAVLSESAPGVKTTSLDFLSSVETAAREIGVNSGVIAAAGALMSSERPPEGAAGTDWKQAAACAANIARHGTAIVAAARQAASSASVIASRINV